MKILKGFTIRFFIFFVLLSSCKQEEYDPFQNIPKDYPILKEVLGNASKYQVQILYTQINRDVNNQPVFETFEFNLNDQTYFYPASTVKLPVAVLALEWLGEQNVRGLSKESMMVTDSVRTSQIPAFTDSTAANLMPSVAHYIKKILLVSDNDAYNRLYELLGQDYINEKLEGKGLKNTVINHRLSIPMSPEENRHFNPIRFFDFDGQEILEIPARETETVFSVSGKPDIGKSFMDGGKLVEQPMDFTFKNKYSLSDFHGTVMRLLFPEKFQSSERFDLSEEDRQFVLKYMSMLPGESDFPKYELPEYYDSYSKFFKFGTGKEPIPAQFRIFNKTGMAYGHLLDGAYFVDFENGVEFFVTAVIYVNENETLNDNQYEFDEVAFPFYSELGEYLYQIELKREKERKPDLNALRIEYDAKILE
ncbi:serine hydrolase [Mongoliibacter ruber]|uniref:beta-lactamase n=1 Tax=Mongoliibacter ruber TaxID=1750599 RepID=A0A2T0WSE3_9BACT|nr:serine hydrolase [Mongoliibacter ruber]PRY89618.1 beta-lactamase family protein [Mongoliibacter ruber]